MKLRTRSGLVAIGRVCLGYIDRLDKRGLEPHRAEIAAQAPVQAAAGRPLRKSGRRSRATGRRESRRVVQGPGRRSRPATRAGGRRPRANRKPCKPADVAAKSASRMVRRPGTGDRDASHPRGSGERGAPGDGRDESGSTSGGDAGQSTSHAARARRVGTSMSARPRCSRTRLHRRSHATRPHVSATAPPAVIERRRG